MSHPPCCQLTQRAGFNFGWQRKIQNADEISPELMSSIFKIEEGLDGTPEVRELQHAKLNLLSQAQQSVQGDPRTFYAYAVVRGDSSEWLGQCGLTVLSSDPNSAFAWYSLLPKYWRQGYMAEAVQALLYAGAIEFKLNRLFAECHPRNQASIRVMQKAGLQDQRNVQITNTTGKTDERVRFSLTGRELERLDGRNIKIEPPV